jgi:hypothetical protein
MSALRYAHYGHGWTLLAEIAYLTGVYDLALFAADKAMAMGRPNDSLPVKYSNVSSVPLHLKAKALAAMGRKHEAIVALNLGLAMGGSQEMLDLKNELCVELGVIP